MSIGRKVQMYKAEKLADQFGPRLDTKMVAKTLNIDERELLARITEGHSSFFVGKSRRDGGRDHGFNKWKFSQVVLYVGFEKAKHVVEQYEKTAGWENCDLVKSYYRTMGDGFLMRWERDFEQIDLIVDRSGRIISKVGYGQLFREFERQNEGSCIGNKGIFFKDYQDQIIYDMPEQDKALLQSVVGELQDFFDE